jgi:hypothetical protein
LITTSNSLLLHGYSSCPHQRHFTYMSIYLCVSVCLSVYGSTVLCWTLAAFQFLHLLHICTLGRTPWPGNQPIARPLPALTGQQKQNKRSLPSMSHVRFEPTILMFQWAKTVHALCIPRGHCDRQYHIIFFNGSSSPFRAQASYSVP